MSVESGNIHVFMDYDDRKYVPGRSYPEDAGFDLYVTEACRVGPQETVNIPCGFEMDLPDGWWALVTARSSTLRETGLLVVQGVIDNGYRGPMFCVVHNLGNAWVVVHRGQRLAQMIPFPMFTGKVIRHTKDEPRAWSARGWAGFGSTGQ